MRKYELVVICGILLGVLTIPVSAQHEATVPFHYETDIQRHYVESYMGLIDFFRVDIPPPRDFASFNTGLYDWVNYVSLVDYRVREVVTLLQEFWNGTSTILESVSVEILLNGQAPWDAFNTSILSYPQHTLLNESVRDSDYLTFRFHTNSVNATIGEEIYLGFGVGLELTVVYYLLEWGNPCGGVITESVDRQLADFVLYGALIVLFILVIERNNWTTRNGNK